MRKEARVSGKYIGEDVDSCGLECIVALAEAVEEQGKVFLRKSLPSILATVSNDAVVNLPCPEDSTAQDRATLVHV